MYGYGCVGFGAQLCGGNSRHGGRDSLSGHGRTQRLGSFMKYYLIVGEASGDLHASHLMKELKARDAEADFRFWGET